MTGRNRFKIIKISENDLNNINTALNDLSEDVNDLNDDLQDLKEQTNGAYVSQIVISVSLSLALVSLFSFGKTITNSSITQSLFNFFKF